MRKRNMTIFYNNVITNDPCCICGQRTDPDGFDFGIEKRLVCLQCAKKYRADLVEIKEEAQKAFEEEHEMRTFTWVEKQGIMFLRTDEAVDMIPVTPEVLRQIIPGVKINKAVYVSWEYTPEGIAEINEDIRSGQYAKAMAALAKMDAEQKLEDLPF